MTFLALGLNAVFAQDGTFTAGGEATGQGGTADYTIGQIFYIANSDLSGSITPGIQQIYEITITTGIENTEINLELSTYPNPTTNFITLKIDHYNNEKLNYQLLDIQGKLLANDQVFTPNTTISFENLPASIYFLKITNDNELLKTFKIIKNQ
jgi:hypothetical protein